jgi:cytochrome c
MRRVSLAVTFALALAGPASAETGDPARGETVYARCKGCHAIERDRVGPRHSGLFGRRAGGVEGYAYSDAMRASGLVWDEETLDRFLADPRGVVPGTTMGFAGVKDARERADLIAYLRSATAVAP